MLPTGSLDAFGPAWSPDGGSLASRRRARATPGDRVSSRSCASTRDRRGDPADDELPGAATSRPTGATQRSPLSLASPSSPPTRRRASAPGKAPTRRRPSTARPTSRMSCAGGGGDVLYGRGKADTLKAGTGKDVLYGGGGSDDFVTRFDGGGDSIDGGQRRQRGLDRLRRPSRQCGRAMRLKQLSAVELVWRRRRRDSRRRGRCQRGTRADGRAAAGPAGRPERHPVRAERDARRVRAPLPEGRSRSASPTRSAASSSSTSSSGTSTANAAPLRWTMHDDADDAPLRGLADRRPQASSTAGGTSPRGARRVGARADPGGGRLRGVPAA